MADMSDDEFLSYCEVHSETPRAMFHIDHIRRLHELAGAENEKIAKATTDFYHFPEYLAQPLVEKARERLRG